MQILFNSRQKPKDYVNKDGEGEYPCAPLKCPFGKCGVNQAMKKNGYYKRQIITITYTCVIRIRRYKCSKCGKTVSMLPSFCLSGMSYSIDFVVALLQYIINIGSIKKTVKHWRIIGVHISRRLLRGYMTRLQNNRKLVQYGLNQISPDNISFSQLPEDTEWTKNFMGGISATLWAEFNAKFHKITGKSFMSLHNTIA